MLDTQGARIATFDGSEEWLAAAASPDGQHIALGNGFNQMVLSDWNGANRTEIQVQDRSPLLDTKGGIRDIAFSLDSQRVLAVSDESTLGGDGVGSLWGLDGQLILRLSGHTAPIVQATFVPHSSWALTASQDGSAKFWPVVPNSNTPHLTLSGHQSALTSLAVSPSGEDLVTADQAGVIRIWRAVGRELPLVHMPDWQPINRARYLPDGQRILASAGGDTALFDLAGQLQRVISDTSLFNRPLVSPDGQQILLFMRDRSARLIDTAGTTIATFGKSDKSPNVSGADLIKSAAFTPDSLHIITVSEFGNVVVWDRAGRQIVELDYPQRYEIANFVVASRDSQHVLLAFDRYEDSLQGGARLWRIDGTPLALLEGHRAPISAAIFSPDGQTLLTVSEDRSGRLWNLRGDLLATFTSPEMNKSTLPTLHMRFSPDGRRFLTLTTDNPLATGLIQLWDSSGKLLATLVEQCENIDFTNCLWPTDAEFSPDGRRIVVVVDGHAELRDADGAHVADLLGHTGSIRSATFSPDGHWIATAANDGTARLWDYNGVPQTVLQGYSNDLLKVQFSPDSRRLLITSYYGEIDQHLIEIPDLLSVAACRVGRGLSEQELRDLQVPTPPHFALTKRHCPPVFESAAVPAHLLITPWPAPIVTPLATARPTLIPTPTPTPRPTRTPTLTPVIGASGAQRTIEGIYVWMENEDFVTLLRFYNDVVIIWTLAKPGFVYDDQGRVKDTLPELFSRENSQVNFPSTTYRLFGEQLEFVTEPKITIDGKPAMERRSYSGAYQGDRIVLTITTNLGLTPEEFDNNRTVETNVVFVQVYTS